MRCVYLIDIDRPGLAAALAERGMVGQPIAIAPEGRSNEAGQGMSHPCRAPLASERVAALRSWWHGPLLMLLSAAATTDDAVVALDGGADDAFPENIADGLIAARIAAMLRRSAGARPIIVGPLVIDPVARTAVRDGRMLGLLPREYLLLLHLALRPGEVVGRPALLKAVCGLEFDPGTNVLDVHLSRLRAKLDRGFDPPMLHTVRGRGFCLVGPAAPPRAPVAGTAVAAVAAAG